MWRRGSIYEEEVEPGSGKEGQKNTYSFSRVSDRLTRIRLKIRSRRIEERGSRESEKGDWVWE